MIGLKLDTEHYNYKHRLPYGSYLLKLAWRTIVSMKPNFVAIIEFQLFLLQIALRNQRNKMHYSPRVSKTYKDNFEV